MSEKFLPQPAASLFADYLERNRDAILDRWRESIDLDSRIVSSESLDVEGLLDHLPEVLVDLTELLRDKEAAHSRKELESNSETHGKERWLQGYSLSEVLLEIDRFRRILLFDAMRAFAAEHPEIELDVHLGVSATLFDFSQEMIVGSVEEYTEARDEELRAANEETLSSNRRLDLLNRQLYLETEKVRQLSLSDPLTKLGNRRQLDARMILEVDRCKRYGEPLTVIMCDLDHFKQVNDSYGHDVGDEVLRSVAAHLEHHSRTTDLVTRYGGEEFVLVLPKTSVETALELAERIRTQLHDLQVLPVREAFTCSFGLAQWRANELPADLIARADRAMYSAKTGGRNRVAVSLSDGSTTMS